MKFSKWIPAAVCALGLVMAGGVCAKDYKKAENEYPNATRQEPKPDMSSSEQRDLSKAAELVSDDKGAEAQPLVEKIIGNARASKYASSFAHQLLGQIYYDQDKSTEALAEYQKAVDTDGLPNAQHFSILYNIAQLQLQDEKYKEALATLDQWEKLTGKQTAEELAAKANIYYRLEQYQPAIDTMKKAMSMTDKPNDSWTQILMASYFELNQYDQAAQIVQQQMAKDPTNKKLLNQLATIYIQADKPQQALDLMAKAKSDGLINTGDDYLQLTKLYASAEKPKEAAATLKEGFAKNLVQPSYDSYKLLGDVCQQSEDDACAMEAYTKAAPMAKDGNVDFQLGYLLFYADKSKDAVEALSRAISRGGLRQEGEAYLLRGDAQNDLNQSGAAMADWQKAAGYPSTKTMAEQRIKAAKGGVKVQKATKKK
ncbi:tetratricopeptide repeat protein [Dokdonella sp.]|uniref:tetratricopeptide repeat protein n=1 Tax=Dokdonella sp. TaxID=2291710 RepID=UPI001B108BA8|nr:tetratricopeptide repeat protein [Dokdonella sp.]MBO9661616.1 tetratricopeptide repeat protein [Dokdonella sp.]